MWPFNRLTRAAEMGDLSTLEVFSSDSPAWFDVGGENALRISAVYSAISLIADSLAGVTLNTFRSEGGVNVPTVAPVWLDNPDDRLTTFDWVHQCLSSLLLRGNAYALVLRDQAGNVREVEWQKPVDVTVNEDSWAPVYAVRGFPHMSVLQGGDLLHVRGFVKPGSVVGLSPVGLFREQFEMSRNAQVFATQVYDGGYVSPSAVAKNTAAVLSQTQADEVKTRIKASVQAGDPIVLDKNWDWQALSLSPAETHFLETIKATATQIGAIFRVDPRDIGGTSDGSLTYSTVEGNQRKFVQRTLMPWALRLEAAFKQLLDPGQIIRFDLEQLARPLALERAKVDTEQLNNGTLTLDEARLGQGRAPLTAQQVSQWQSRFGKNTQTGAGDGTAG